MKGVFQPAGTTRLHCIRIDSRPSVRPHQVSPPSLIGSGKAIDRIRKVSKGESAEVIWTYYHDEYAVME